MLLNDKKDFGHSQGIEVTSLPDQEFVDLDDIDTSAPTGSFELNNHEPASHGNNAGKKRDRSPDRDDDELEEDHVRKK